jgi:penicillin-binding protein 1A
MKSLAKLTRNALAALFALAVAGVLVVFGTYLYLAPGLPSIDTLKDVRLQVPLRVYARDGGLIAEFGEMRRIPLGFEEVPQRLAQAVLASEDDRFYRHPGVDWQGLLRAAWVLVKTGHKGQGGSTITMQVARNFFLGREKTFLRKFNEIFLALKIERELSKDEILALYLNKIFLGHRAYGVGAAASVYYGKSVDELSLAQAAMIAGLPQAPSASNPISSPERAVRRRNYVLGRMRELGFIDETAYREAVAAPVTASYHGPAAQVAAPYVAEMVRREMLERHPDDAYTAGYEVYTTVRAPHQAAAARAVREALLAYDRRHGYRGPEGRVAFPQQLATQAVAELAREALGEYSEAGGLLPALVSGVEERAFAAYLADGTPVEVAFEGMGWARPYLSENRRGPAPQKAADVVARGDVVRLERVRADGEEGAQWRLAQLPAVSGALVSLDPDDGAITALVGGFDFRLSKFNRATQARRQPGSNFKPFLYSAGLEHGLTPATLINDAPLPPEYDASLESAWRPENYSGKFYGPTRLRQALVKSRNLVSIRLLRRIGVPFAREYAARFGFREEQLPSNLSLALGSMVATPLEVVSAYAVLANSGYRVEPYLIERIEDGRGEVVYRAHPLVVCPQCEPAPADPAAAAQPSAGEAAGPPGERPSGEREGDGQRPAPRVISAQNAYLMSSILRDVIRYGTGRRALSLGRADLAGKTGTTNEQRDAWFSGFNGDLVATVWVGFDKLDPLGRGETGSRAALPMWIAYMGEVLKGEPETPLERPPGLVTVRIDPQTGKLAAAGDPEAIFETFLAGSAPTGRVDRLKAQGTAGGVGSTVHPEQLF